MTQQDRLDALNAAYDAAVASPSVSLHPGAGNVAVAKIELSEMLFDSRNELVTRDRADELEEALHKIAQWSKAYPLSVFPEPDFKKAAELLKAGGMTLDAISASCMRHVVEGVGKIARTALKAGDQS